MPNTLVCLSFCCSHSVSGLIYGHEGEDLGPSIKSINPKCSSLFEFVLKELQRFVGTLRLGIVSGGGLSMTAVLEAAMFALFCLISSRVR